MADAGPDTIFALASARGKAGISVLRVSGSSAFRAARVLCGRTITARRPTLCTLRNEAGDVLDRSLVLAFDRGASFSGEKTVEFHVHGSPAVVQSVQAALACMPGLRPAQPGEFTRRALDNGCLDLSQVEGLADLIEAETEHQRLQALHVMRGGLRNLVDEWRSSLLRAMALLDATFDFPDEDDVPVDVRADVLRILDDLEVGFRSEIRGSFAAERVREGFEVAIIGPPNVGKSTLLNALSGREAAITSETAGTTRDIIEVRMDVNGIPVTFLDTAGLRDSGDEVESLGIERARTRADSSDVRLFLTLDGEASGLGVDCRPGDIVCRGKCDLLESGPGLAVSGVTGQGIEDIIGRLDKDLSSRVVPSQSAIRERHRDAISRALECLVATQERLRRELGEPELAYEKLRSCAHALNSIIGRVDVEDVLDEIFASFCMGK